MRMLLLAPLAALLLSGCVSTAAGIITAPVRAVGQTADWLTTSQSESDRNYGRKMRKKEAREGAERRKADRKARREAERESDRND